MTHFGYWDTNDGPYGTVAQRQAREAREAAARPPADDHWAAIRRYQRDCAAGRITFDAEGFAATYPGKAATDAGVAQFIAGHVVNYGQDSTSLPSA